MTRLAVVPATGPGPSGAATAVALHSRAIARFPIIGRSDATPATGGRPCNGERPHRIW